MITDRSVAPNVILVLSSVTTTGAGITVVGIGTGRVNVGVDTLCH